ncbi:MAG: hypothetical protein H7Z40_01570 [Phycisphaerae bacterium]|nr:hypothetical protein [Gemmatimonadaceae bacterium]
MPRILIQACCIATLFAVPANSQEALDAPKHIDTQVAARIPTRIALRSERFQGHEVVVLRRPLNEGGDIIVLSGPSITPKRLAAAAVFLTSVRESMGDDVAKVSMIPVPYTPGVDAMAVDIKAAGRSLTKLRTAAHQDVPRIGSVQMMTIYLPSSTGREALRKRGIVDFSKGRGGRAGLSS